jgi:hypothetical protein
MIKICKNGIFELYFQGRYYGCVRVEDLIPAMEGVGNFHIDIIRFTHNTLNRMQRDEESLMGYIKNNGYTELISFVDASTVKNGNVALWKKFIKLFEFDAPKLFTRRTI